MDDAKVLGLPAVLNNLPVVAAAMGVSEAVVRRLQRRALSGPESHLHREDIDALRNLARGD